MRNSSVRDLDPYFTPARAGLITIAVFVFVVIFARIVTMQEQRAQEQRAEARAQTAEAPPVESAEPITQGIGGIKGLRGTLP
jgi:hypothetical protein